MEFKIDTKGNYTRIMPVGSNLNAEMADNLLEQCTTLAEQGSQNYLIDLSACQTAEPTAFEGLAALHEMCYGNSQSVVFTAYNDTIKAATKAAGIDDMLNMAPTDAEAIDIISMEVLERDLMAGDE